MTCFSEKSIRAVRKAHQCVGCLKMLAVGDPAVNWTGLNDGDFVSVYYHPECRDAEVALNTLHGTFGEEWQGLADAEREDYPWLKAEHPTAYLRLVSPQALGGTDGR
jgi:hypothetical protein